jgi:molybdate transport system substrate-binding protein
MRKFIAVSILFVMSSGFSKAQNKMLIAAASDLKFTLDSLIFVFSKTHNGKVDVTYGSSGKLTEQIVNGAPFDLFFSADIFYPERLKHEKKTSSEIYHYATGKIVIWSKKIDPNKLGMKSLLDPAIKKVAIANPLHAPYGKRAIESLAYFKMSEILKSKLVYGENISQTAQFISTGAADVGIIALSLALSPNMKREKGSYFVIPAGSHEPLIQGAVVTTHGRNNELAAVFFDFLKTADAAAILSHYGFSHSNTDQN